jgi:hypothetical protein
LQQGSGPLGILFELLSPFRGQGVFMYHQIQSDEAEDELRVSCAGGFQLAELFLRFAEKAAIQ